MALKEDIQQAFENSIDGNSDKITQLAIDLEKAIENFMLGQTFKVDKLSATAVGVQGTTAPGTATGAAGPSVTNPTGVSIPKITAEVNLTGTPDAITNSKNSEVRLKEINRSYPKVIK